MGRRVSLPFRRNPYTQAWRDDGEWHAGKARGVFSRSAELKRTEYSPDPACEGGRTRLFFE